MVHAVCQLMAYTKQKEEIDNNVTFFVYFDHIRYLIKHTPHISVETMETYKDIVHFKEGMHHMYVQEKKDPVQQWFPTNYKLTTRGCMLHCE
jgi:hypothetical protein